MDRHPIRRIGVDNIDFASGFHLLQIDGHEYTGQVDLERFLPKIKSRQVDHFRISTYGVLHHTCI